MVSLSLLLALLAAQPAPAPTVRAPAPLDESARAVFWGSAEDEPPEVLGGTEERLEGRHYLTCDEWNLELFEPHIRDLGGAYVGVGSDQAYLFIGWMKPELAFLADYDIWVRHVHRAYAVFLAEAKTPAGLIAAFAPAMRAKSVEILKERLGADPEAPIILSVFARAHEQIYWRLKRLEVRLKKAGVPCWLTDQGQYDYVRDLVAAGRVRPLLGNLLNDKGYRGVGQAAATLGVPIRVVYLSNAEGYWSYSDTFCANMKALPFDERSLVLRTIAAKWTNKDYRYNVQTLASFRAFLDDPQIRSVKGVVPWLKIHSREDIPLSKVDWRPGDKAPRDGGRLNEPVPPKPGEEAPVPTRPTPPDPPATATP